MKVSVALTTYNGSKFIRKQLESLYNQSRTIDEVIINDDKSDDETYNIIKFFISDNNLQDKWKLYENIKRKGAKGNFFDCIEKTNGDVVFFCDQDDIWHTDKVEKMLTPFGNEKVIAVMCLENKIDDNDNYLTKGSGDGKLIKISFDRQIRECLGAGHLIAIRKAFFDKYRLELIKSNMTFDVPICIVAALKDGFFLLNEELVDRRIHRNNTTGLKMGNPLLWMGKDRYLEGRKMRLSYFKYIEKCYTDDLVYYGLDEYESAIQMLSDSLDALSERRMLPLVKELASKNKFINKKLSLLNLFFVGKR